MRSSHARINRGLVLLVVASLAVFVASAVLCVGIDATPYNTIDSEGRTMGFNDVFSREHYVIAVGNFRPMRLLTTEYTYEWVLLAAHLVGATLLVACGRACSRATRWFFAAQVIVFPLGVPALLLLPILVGECLLGSMDREGFVDIPFVLVFSQSVWIATSITIMFALRGNGLFRPRQTVALALPIEA
jgi:hypothetical protein